MTLCCCCGIVWRLGIDAYVIGSIIVVGAGGRSGVMVGASTTATTSITSDGTILSLDDNLVVVGGGTDDCTLNEIPDLADLFLTLDDVMA